MYDAHENNEKLFNRTVMEIEEWANRVEVLTTECVNNTASRTEKIKKD